MSPDDHDHLLSEQLSRIADAIGGSHRYRGHLSGNNVIGEQWNALARDEWPRMLCSPDPADAIPLQTLCTMSEQFGEKLVVAPLMNVAIGHAFLSDHLPPGSTPLVVLAGRSDSGACLPPLTSATHALIIDQDDDARTALVQIKSGEAESVLLPEGPVYRLAKKSRKESRIADAPAMRRTLDAILLVSAAELTGIATASFQLALDHIRLRKQFRRPLGSFQALQHRAANDMIAIEETRSLITQLARLHDRHRLPPRTASAAICKAVEIAFGVCTSSIQMLGAIGFTAEHDAGLYLKRTMEITRLVGPACAHRYRFGASSLATRLPSADIQVDICANRFAS